MRRLPAVILAMLMAVSAAACSSTSAPLPSFSGQSITVVATGLQFQPTQMSLPAGQPLRIVLDNQDAGVPHNIRVFSSDTEIAKSPTITGTGQTEVRFGPLAAGTYQFACEVHPSMMGTLTITP
jgi:plastocyanin